MRSIDQLPSIMGIFGAHTYADYCGGFLCVGHVILPFFCLYSMTIRNHSPVKLASPPLPNVSQQPASASHKPYWPPVKLLSALDHMQAALPLCRKPQNLRRAARVAIAAPPNW